MPTRAALFVGTILLDCFIVVLLSIGHDHSKGPIKGFKKKMVLALHYYVNKTLLIIAGMKVEVMHEDMDYTEWLGPDYKKDLQKVKRSTAYVSNHSSWLDGFMMCYLFQPATTPAADVIGDLPVFSTIFRSVDSIIAYRGNDLKRRAKVA